MCKLFVSICYLHFGGKLSRYLYHYVCQDGMLIDMVLIINRFVSFELVITLIYSWLRDVTSYFVLFKMYLDWVTIVYSVVCVLAYCTTFSIVVLWYIVARSVLLSCIVGSQHMPRLWNFMSSKSSQGLSYGLNLSSIEVGSNEVVNIGISLQQACVWCYLSSQGWLRIHREIVFSSLVTVHKRSQ